MWWLKNASEAAKALLSHIAPELARMVREEVKRSLADDAQTRLMVASAAQDYLEKTHNQVLGLMRTNTDLLNTLRELLEDYDGVNDRITNLSKRVDELSGPRDART